MSESLILYFNDFDIALMALPSMITHGLDKFQLDTSLCTSSINLNSCFLSRTSHKSTKWLEESTIPIGKRKNIELILKNN